MGLRHVDRLIALGARVDGASFYPIVLMFLCQPLRFQKCAQHGLATRAGAKPGNHVRGGQRQMRLLGGRLAA